MKTILKTCGILNIIIGALGVIDAFQPFDIIVLFASIYWIFVGAIMVKATRVKMEKGLK